MAQAAKLHVTEFSSGHVGLIFVCVVNSLKQLYALVCLRHVLSAKEALTRPEAKLESFPSSNILLKGAVVFEYLHLAVEVASLRPGQNIPLQWENRETDNV